MKEELKKKLKKELSAAKEKLEDDLSRIADKDEELEEDWNARYPDIGFETSEDRDEDRAAARTIYEERKGVEQVLEVKLKKIKEALERIKEGDYGTCQKCDNPISEKRLKAVPEAKTCKNCLDS